MQLSYRHSYIFKNVSNHSCSYFKLVTGCRNSLQQTRTQWCPMSSDWNELSGHYTQSAISTSTSVAIATGVSVLRQLRTAKIRNSKKYWPIIVHTFWIEWAQRKRKSTTPLIADELNWQCGNDEEFSLKLGELGAAMLLDSTRPQVPAAIQVGPTWRQLHPSC